MIKDSSTTGQEQKLADISQHPNQLDLTKLLQFSELRLELLCTFAWPTLGQLNTKFVLGVTSPTPTNRKSWGEQQTQQSKLPEWQLFLDVDGTRREMWRVRSADMNLILSLTAYDALDQISDTRPNLPGSDTSRDVKITKPISFGAPSHENTQQPLRNKSELTEADANIAQQSTSGVGLMLAGDIKDVEISSIMQSIMLCKMTGRLNLMDTYQQIEVYFAEGELVHARGFTGLNEDEHLIGEKAVLDIFTWTDGTFKFQHGWQTSNRSVQRRLESLLLEGATLLDYKTFLADRKISPSSILMVATEMADISEAAFDQILKTGIPSYETLQKQVFLLLKTPKPLKEVIEQLKLPQIAWMTIIFNLINMKMIMLACADVDSKTRKQFDSVSELITTTQKVLRQPESNMYSFPLFLFLAQNELARCASGGMPFCISMLEFDQGGYPPDRSAIASIAAAFDSIRQPFDVVAYAMPNQCFTLFPQSKREDAQKKLDQFSAHLQHKSSFKLNVRSAIASVPEDGNDLKQLLNRISNAAKDDAITLLPKNSN